MIGERVVCIKEEPFNQRVKIGMLFTVINKTLGRTDVEYWTVISDDGYKCGWIDANHFRTLSEIREEKLQELGI
jgi:hypothetical protein